MRKGGLEAALFIRQYLPYRPRPARGGDDTYSSTSLVRAADPVRIDAAFAGGLVLHIARMSSRVQSRGSSPVMAALDRPMPGRRRSRCAVRFGFGSMVTESTVERSGVSDSRR